jgi:hypothetical protein
MKKKGVKHSKGKLPYHIVLCKQFPNAINAVVERSLQGHIKYKKWDKDWKNWERVDDPINNYSNALMRHVFNNGEDSELQHAVAVAWNSLAVLELKLKKNGKNNKKRN